MPGMWRGKQWGLWYTSTDFPLHMLIDLVIHTTICATVSSIIYGRLA